MKILTLYSHNSIRINNIPIFVFSLSENQNVDLWYFFYASIKHQKL